LISFMVGKMFRKGRSEAWSRECGKARNQSTKVTVLANTHSRKVQIFGHPRTSGVVREENINPRELHYGQAFPIGDGPATLRRETDPMLFWPT
jgi:hypothetical protein